MVDPTPLICEVWTNDGWIAVSLKEARTRYSAATKRCPICHGAVSMFGTYTEPTRRYSLSHRILHTGCPLGGKNFSGQTSMHPQVLS